MNQPKTFIKFQFANASKFQVCTLSVNGGEDDNNLPNSQIYNRLATLDFIRHTASMTNLYFGVR